MGSSKGGEEASTSKNQSEQYNQFAINQILTLSNLYLMTMINSYMEYQRLDQSTQL